VHRLQVLPEEVIFPAAAEHAAANFISVYTAVDDKFKKGYDIAEFHRELHFLPLLKNHLVVVHIFFTPHG
jgi:hypothetical protein